MARPLNKLSDMQVKSVKKPRRYGDGGGLYLNVSVSGSKAWVFLWTRGGVPREMGLGSYPAVTLSAARTMAADCRSEVQAGRDPIAERSKEAEPTFGECADRFLESMGGSWRNDKHRNQWRMTLTEYCSPIRDRRVSLVTTDDVLSILTPIWNEKNETASRLRGRMERVLNYAKTKGWRTGENPAVWRGHLKNVLPPRQKLQRGHHAAMPYTQVPAFVGRLDRAAMSAKALEVLILTACRSGEVLGARWTEIDLDAALWVIPAKRMKAGKEHQVPLVPRVVAILRELHEVRDKHGWVFPGQKEGRPLSNMAMENLLGRMKVDFTVHGFRSSFRDWAGDETSFPREVAEAALAHKVGDDTENAYRRATALEKRRKLMTAWAGYVGAVKAGNVTQFRKKTANPQG
ncbi:MAG: integrase arm-type DNA-binding domain-containing protein [Mesorhizobium sp.]|nr:site-specific integrase [Mesorhizobium sp.]MBL8577718.1 integrase arm-type DNA-binding domain-containing protein [Mesorhizobium sp.]